MITQYIIVHLCILSSMITLVPVNPAHHKSGSFNSIHPEGLRQNQLEIDISFKDLQRKVFHRRQYISIIQPNKTFEFQNVLLQSSPFCF